MNPVASSYIHAIEGRLRIKVPVIQGSGVNAATIKGALEQLSGIRFVKANPTTGNVLVLFDPQELTQQEIIDRLIELKAFERRIGWHSSGAGRLSGRIAETLMQSAVEIALERVILALA